jgi:hypothetical protein
MKDSSLSLKKKFIFHAVMITFVLVFTEAFAHLGYRAIMGEFLWQTESRNAFSIRDFIQLVDDERFFTNKRNFSNGSIQTDENGFRLGLNKYSKDKPSFVFLGDSVPFGWNVKGNETIPSKFYKALLEVDPDPPGVINAAIPSYSLHQSVKRYEYEIHKKFQVRCVILQIYDPLFNLPNWDMHGTKILTGSPKNGLIFHLPC